MINRLIILDFLFAEFKRFILVEIPFWISNENTVKIFLDKSQSFVHHRFDIVVKWSTKKIGSFFYLKDKNKHPACKGFEGTYSCSANCIGETKKILRHSGMNWRNQMKILNQLNTSDFTDHN